MTMTVACMVLFARSLQTYAEPSLVLEIVPEPKPQGTKFDAHIDKRISRSVFAIE
jgi:hypothetical protein